MAMDGVPPAKADGTLARVIGFAAQYKAGLIGYAALLAASAAVAMIPPLLLRHLVDTAIPHHRLGLIDALSAGAAAGYLAAAVLMLIGGYVGTRVGTAIIRDLRRALFDHVQHMPLGFFVHTRTGALLSRMNQDVVAAQQLFTGQMFTGSVGSLGADVLILVATLAVMFVLSWPITLLALAVTPLFVLPSRLAGKATRRLTREQMELYAGVTTFATERFGTPGALLVKLFGLYRRELELFTGRVEALRRNNIAINTVAQTLGTGLSLLSSAGLVAVYWLGGRLVTHGEVTIGTLVALALYAQRAYTPIADLASAKVNIQAAMISFSRVFEVLDAAPAVEEPKRPVIPSSIRGDIAISHVSFGYRAEAAQTISSLAAATTGTRSARTAERAIDNVSFQVPAGTMTALVGPSGAGKTTLSHLIRRMYDPDAGTIRIDGTDVREFDSETLASIIGVVTQESHFFHESVRENLRYAKPSATDAELRAACRTAAIDDLVAGLPDGYDTIVGEGGYRFSGGEQQRLALARIILRNPRIVILDEATAHLDSNTEQLVQQALAATLTGRTSVVIAHRLSTVRAADQIVVLNHGSVDGIGTHDELLRGNAFYQQLYRAQSVTTTR
jgi:ATP-binding cassette subfamily B protein